MLIHHAGKVSRDIVSMINYVLYITVYVSSYLYLSKHIESNQLCYFYLASYPIPVNLFDRTLCLVPKVLPQSKLQIVLCKTFLNHSKKTHTILEIENPVSAICSLAHVIFFSVFLQFPALFNIYFLLHMHCSIII